jgi:type II secretion system protein G
MKQKEKAFTLIELIIVVVIIGILALVAIPRYFTNVAKAQKSQVYSNLDTIRQALLSYYAVNGAYPAPNTFPIAVNVDGDTIMNVTNASNTNWVYYFVPSAGDPIYAYKQPGNSCWYGIGFGGDPRGSCTP